MESGERMKTRKGHDEKKILNYSKHTACVYSTSLFRWVFKFVSVSSVPVSVFDQLICHRICPLQRGILKLLYHHAWKDDVCRQCHFPLRERMQNTRKGRAPTNSVERKLQVSTHTSGRIINRLLNTHEIPHCKIEG